MKVRNYNIYNSLYINLIDDRDIISQKMDLFAKDYDYFETECDHHPDITIIISDFDEKTDVYLLENDKFAVDSGYLFGKKKYKIAKFTYSIEICKSGSIITKISPNFFANRVIHHLLLDYLINIGLFSKGYSNLHCSGIEKDREAILLTGPGGSGKTSFALKCLEMNYKLLGDDRIFLKNGIAYPFPESPGIEYDNLNYIKSFIDPWTRYVVIFNKFINIISKGYVGATLSKKFLDVFPKNVLAAESVVKSIIFLQPSTKFGVESINRNELIRKLYINQVNEDKYMSEIIYNYSTMFPKNFFVNYVDSYSEILDKNLPNDIDAQLIRFPKKEYGLVNKWLEDNL